ncbi:MAG: hypothetical protein HY568_02785 [Candidatus Latescibacteria bacterium]|nr:hypothetical protein [Candidatus Latescibacterota bacterium]
MPRIGPTDLTAIERTPTSPAALTQGLSHVLASSLAIKAKVESCNWETGEYRVVLQGTLDMEETKFEKP